LGQRKDHKSAKNIEGKGKRADIYLEVRKRREHIFFE
jgi:hypothetical protein